MKIPKIVKNVYWTLFGLALFFLFGGLNLIYNPSAIAKQVSAQSLVQSANLLTNKTLSNLGKFSTGGSVQLPPAASSVLGVSSIKWSAGQTPAQAIPMGVWNAAFKVGSLTPVQINPTVDIGKAALSNFGYLKNMPIDDLVEGIPNLIGLNINSVPPIANAVAQAVAGGAAIPSLISAGIENPVQTIGQLLQVPGWNNMPLPNLSSFAANSIPGLINTPIANFPKIAALPALAFPGLPTMPIIDMPGYKLPAGYQIGKLDIVHTKEPTKRKVISGSDQEPNAKCLKMTCNSIEIQGYIKSILDGSQIVDGNTQKVKGGSGFLSMVAGGKEPPGLYPYGDSLKEVYKDVNAKAGTVNRAWYFRYCQSGWGYNLGCTPYFIGPIPIGSLKEASKVPLLLGNISIPISDNNINDSDLEENILENSELDSIAAIDRNNTVVKTSEINSSITPSF